MKLEKVKSVLSNILESKEEKSLANPVEPIETKVDVVDAETAEEDTEKINKEVNKRIKDIEKNALAVKGEDHAEEPKLVKESKEFKKEERKELGAFIHELKEKKIKHIVKRSVNEGYRYLVEFLNPVKEEAEEWECQHCHKHFPATDEGGRVETDLGFLCNNCIKELSKDSELHFEDESLKEGNERKYIKTRNSCVDAADLADELEAQDIKYEFEDDGLSVDAKDYDRAMNILYDLEANCDESLKEEKEPIDLEALRFYVKNWSEGDNITVTADLLNVLEQALKMAEKHGLKESKLNEVDLETSSTKQIEIKPEKKDPSEEEEDKTEIVIKKEEEPVEEGAQGKKEPGIEFVVFDASTEGKAPILGIRSTRVEAEWLMNRLMKTGKYDNVSFDEAPKGRFHKGDDFWGPFDDNWEKMESVKEAVKKDDGTCPHCHSSNIDFVDSDEDSTKYVCRDCGEDFIVLDDGSVTTRNGRPIEEAIDTSKEVWEGWTVQDFIDELEPSFEQIMRGESWIKPFANKEELKKWCMSEQPYYKKYIPEVVSYFDGRVKEFGGYGKKASDGWFHEGVISGAEKLSYDELAELEKGMRERLDKAGVYYTEGTFDNASNSLADLEVSLLVNGDWKHDHLLAEDVVEKYVEELGYVISRHTEEITDDTGRDDYEAWHTWILIKDTNGKMKDTVAGFKKMFAKAEPEEEDESLEEDINIKINKDNIEITEPTEEGEETVAVIETPKAGEESEVAPEEEQPEEGAPEESEEEIKEPVEEELGKETIYIKYWEDEELRDQGISEIYLDKFESVEDAKEVARKLIDRDGFASVEVFISPKGEIESADDKLVWGYDGVDTWEESLEKKTKATITNEEFENIDEDDVSWMTSTDMSALKEANVEEEPVTESTTKKVVNFEDVEEDDISWLK